MGKYYEMNIVGCIPDLERPVSVCRSQRRAGPADGGYPEQGGRVRPAGTATIIIFIIVIDIKPQKE